MYSQRKYTINESWEFNKSNVENGWITVSIPHTWNDKDAVDDTPGYYRGTGWYRKNVFIDSGAENKSVYVYFEGANQETELYVNEQLAGKHKGGYTRFCFDVTPFIKTGTVNLFTVKVDNAHNENIPPLSADFTFFGGIYRDVYLVVKEKIHVSMGDYASPGIYIKTPQVSKDEASVEIETVISNGLPKNSKVCLEHYLYSPSGEEVSVIRENPKLLPGSDTNHATKPVKVKNPQLWSPDSPELYTLKTQIWDEKRKVLLDEAVNNFGFRWFAFTADKGFFLNGKPLKLIGTNRHQCYENLGFALRDEMHVQDVLLLKSMGGNLLRVSHYPQDPVVMDLCDKLGIITSVEIPIVNAITEGQAFLDNSLQMAMEMVKQDFNRPSVVIWAYMNEVMLRPPFSGERHKQYCREVNRHARAIEELLRKEDPLRYTMIPFHGSVSAYEDAGLFEVPQIIGWNLYQGWYGGQFSGFDSFMDQFHQKYPGKPSIITEYGADVDPRLHSFHPQRFDYTAEYANLYHDHYLKAIVDRDYIAGAAIWNLNDFHSESRGNAVPHINSKGITGLDRTPKDTYLFYRVFMRKEPLVLIGGKDWKTRGGVETEAGRCVQPLRIYSNLPEIDVTVNGKSIGKKIPVKNQVAEIHIPFENKENLIVASGTKDGQTVQDFYRCDFSLVPVHLSGKIPVSGINIMLGSSRYFEDRASSSVWIPEQEYKAGSWGYVGGQAFRPKSRFGGLPVSDLNILGTGLDPVFQTQREDIRSFRFDVEKGRYALYLYWAELIPVSEKETLAYNLGNDANYESRGNRSFHLKINNEYVLKDFDIAAQAGAERAVIKKFEVNVTDSNGISVDFEAVSGKPVLNAIRLIKLN
ncbi:beta-galactosidase [Bacteroidia bacterium]|nr:beta-galactosidase [Bacteroidia bacterium]